MKSSMFNWTIITYKRTMNMLSRVFFGVLKIFWNAFNCKFEYVKISERTLGGDKLQVMR